LATDLRTPKQSFVIFLPDFGDAFHEAGTFLKLRPLIVDDVQRAWTSISWVTSFTKTHDDRPMFAEISLNHRQKRIVYVNSKHLTNYLKDHFAGSVAALELLDHLISFHRGETGEVLFLELRQEIGEDQEVLGGLLRELDTDSGAVRNTTAFLGEKLTRVKLLLEDPAGGQLALLEKLEALALGIEGKRALWRSMLAIADETAALHRLDLNRLDRRAEDQRQRVEQARIEAAREAFLAN
jgi:hypothetical protein